MDKLEWPVCSCGSAHALEEKCHRYIAMLAQQIQLPSRGSLRASFIRPVLGDRHADDTCKRLN